MPNFARVADMVGGLRGAIADYRNNDRQAMQDKLSMVKQFMDVHSQETRGQLETAQAQEAAMRTRLLPGQYQAELSQQEIQRNQQASLDKYRAFEVEQAGRKLEQQNRFLSTEEKQPYQKHFPEEYAQWFEGNITQAQMDKIVDTIKYLEEQRFKTMESKAKANIDEQKVTSGLNEQKAYEEFGTTKGAVVAGTEIAQLKKAEQDVEIAKATVKLRELQGDVAKMNAQRVKEGKSPAEMNPYQKKLQIQLDMVDALVAQGAPELEAFRTVFDSKELTYANVSSMRNEVVRQISALPPDSPEKTALLAKIELYDSILDPTLQRMAGKKPTTELTAKEIVRISARTYMEYTPKIRTEFLRQQATNGIKRIDLVGDDEIVNQVINIKQDTDRNYIITNAEGKPLGKIGRVAPKQQATTPQATAKPTQKSAVQGSQNPKVQAVIQSLKSKGITSINQLEPDIIQALKAQGIYDQVLKLLGG